MELDQFKHERDIINSSITRLNYRMTDLRINWIKSLCPYKLGDILNIKILKSIKKYNKTIIAKKGDLVTVTVQYHSELSIKGLSASVWLTFPSTTHAIRVNTNQFKYLKHNDS